MAEISNVAAVRSGRVAYAMAALLFAVVAAVFTVSSVSRAIADHDRELREIVSIGARAVDTYFTTIEKALGELGAQLQSEGMGPGTTVTLARFKKRFPEFQIVAVGSPEGRGIASSEGQLTSGSVDNSREPSFLDARAHLLQGEGMVVSQPFLGLLTRAWLLRLRYGVRDEQGALRHILIAGLSQQATQALWQGALVQQDSTLGLVRDDNYVVARQPVPQERAATIFSEPVTGVLASHLLASHHPKAGVVRGISTATGRETSYVYERLAHYPLTFYATNPASNLAWAWWAAAWPTYLLLLLILFSGGCAIFYWLDQRQQAWQRERVAHLAEVEQGHAELAAFNYMLSHDLRAPIRAVEGYAAMLAASLPAQEQGQLGLLGKVRGSAQRMWELLDDLMALSRDAKQALAKSQVDMERKVRSIVAEAGPEAARVRFEIGVLPPARGDLVLLRQVWGNLITNAVKFSTRTAQPVVRIGFEDGTYFVEDNGAGFDMTHADKLFRIFSRLHSDDEFPGNGIGLVIVKRVVQWHGGRVWARARVGEGARFSFTLPD